ncbi:MAG: hypothetical protein PHI36_06020 [Bacteroidales bacterium]|nr:hypothetical protein [Bacteroidales bacterium]
MKNKIKNTSIVLLIAIYCFAMGIATKSAIHSDFKNPPRAEQETFFSTISTNLFCHTSQSENSINNINDFPSPRYTDSYNSIWAVNKTTEHFLDIAFLQYDFFSKNLLIRFQKNNIIFPFHCFW